MEHGTSEKVFHQTRFDAVFFASIHVQPAASNSWFMARLHVFRGLPLLLLACGFHSGACRVIESLGRRMVCPIHLHFLIPMVFWRGLVLVLT